MKRNIRIMYAAGLLQGMVFYAPIATLYRQAVGISIFQITLIESISMAIAIAMEIPWGYIADRIGYRRTMIFCGALYFISKAVFWRAESFAEFLLERILLGIVCAGLSGVDSSILYLSCKDSESQKVFGIYNALSETGMLFSATVFSAFIGENYRLSAFLTMTAYGVSAILMIGLREVKAEDSERHGFRETVGLFKALLRNRRILYLLISAALIGETSHTITVFLNQPIYVRSGMSSAVISAVFVIMTLAGIASSALFR